MKAIVIDPGTEPVVKTVPETLQALGGLRANTAQYTANRYEEDEDFE